MLKKMFKFIKDYFFYRVKKEEKERIRSSVVIEDHKSFRVILLIIAFLQIGMYVLSLIQYGFIVPDKEYVIQRRILYAFLAVICFAALFFTRLFYKKKLHVAYFAVANVLLLAIAVWGAGISIIDSYGHIDLTVYAYVLLAIPLFILIEPWVASIDMIVVTSLMMTHFGMKGLLTTGTIINLLSILLLSIMAITFIFQRRIKKLNLQYEIEDLNKKLQERSIVDELTKVFNRRYLTDHINNPLNIGSCCSGVLMIDLDSFKKVNDDYGHHIGDETLQRVGEVLLPYINDKDYVVRYGGEEFLVFFNCIKKEELFNKAEEIRLKMADCRIPISKSEHINFTVSIGCALATPNITYSGLISKADKALYKAKTTKNTSVI